VARDEVAAETDAVDRLLTLPELLAIAREFDDYGVSRGFVAWELAISESAVTKAWREAEGAGMLEPIESHHNETERLWRLTALGHARLAA
jgi:DNA-binding MarR family transcriptional regulator